MAGGAQRDVHQRVYLPLTFSSLRRARVEGGFGEPPVAAHAVTQALLSELGEPPVDEEEAEYAALTGAALEALTLLGPDEPPRRVVAAVDVPAWEPRSAGEHASGVLVPTPVRWRRVVSVLVDGPEAEGDVAAALGGASAAIERCLDHELGWFAVQEVDGLLSDVSWGRPPGRATIR